MLRALAPGFLRKPISAPPFFEDRVDYESVKLTMPCLNKNTSDSILSDYHLVFICDCHQRHTGFSDNKNQLCLRFVWEYPGRKTRCSDCCAAGELDAPCIPPKKRRSAEASRAGGLHVPRNPLWDIFSKMMLLAQSDLGAWLQLKWKVAGLFFVLERYRKLSGG